MSERPMRRSHEDECFRTEDSPGSPEMLQEKVDTKVKRGKS